MTECIYLVQSGDKGAWIWPSWYYYHKKNWRAADFIDTVFLGQTVAPEFDGVVPMTTGKSNWGKEMIGALKKMDCKYIILSHEDYFESEPTRTEKLKQLIAFMKKHGTLLMKASGWDAGCNCAEHPKQETDYRMGDEIIWRYDNKSPYLISHQIAIWEREFLISTIPEWGDIWAHEIDGTDMLRKRNVEILCCRSEAPISYVEVVQMGRVREGADKWFREASEDEVRI